MDKEENTQKDNSKIIISNIVEPCLKKQKLYNGLYIVCYRYGRLNKIEQFIECPFVENSKFFTFNDGDKFIYTCDLETMNKALEESGYDKKCTESDLYVKAKNAKRGEPDKILRFIQNKPRILNLIKYKEVKCIRNWKKIKVNTITGQIDIIDEFDEPEYNSIKLSTLDGYNLIKDWMIRTKREVDFLIDTKQFIPTITGGVDTRTLTAFWRYRVNDLTECSYLQHAIKPDIHADKVQGDAEVKIAEKVAERLFPNGFTRAETIPPLMRTLSGAFTDASLIEQNMNDIRFKECFIDSHNISVMSPFSFEEFLKIKHEKAGLTRTVLALLLAEDLMDIPLVGCGDRFVGEGYNFFDTPHKIENHRGDVRWSEGYGDCVEKAREILSYWGEKRVNKLKEILHTHYDRVTPSYSKKWIKDFYRNNESKNDETSPLPKEEL